MPVSPIYNLLRACNAFPEDVPQISLGVEEEKKEFNRLEIGEGGEVICAMEDSFYQCSRPGSIFSDIDNNTTAYYNQGECFFPGARGSSIPGATYRSLYTAENNSDIGGYVSSCERFSFHEPDSSYGVFNGIYMDNSVYAEVNQPSLISSPIPFWRPYKRS